MYSTTNDFYTTKREGEEETKRDPPPKKTPGAPNLGFYKIFLGFYFVCVFWVVERTYIVRKSSFLFLSLITLNLHVRKSTHTHARANAREHVIKI